MSSSSDYIYAGKSVTSTADHLARMPIDYIYRRLVEPKEELRNLVRSLRIIRQVDRKRYGALKRTLPYLVCPAFNPPFRNKDNFAYTQHFIVDIDDLSAKSIPLEQLKARLASDERVVLAFASPSNDGLKLLFKLSERCYDAGVYSLFYKTFVRKLSAQYQLDQLVDTCTSDVSRACFMSVDPKPCYNPDAAPVDMGAYIDLADTSRMLQALHQEQQLAHDEAPQAAAQHKAERGPDQQALDDIKAILKVKAVKKPEKQVYVPQQLDDIAGDLKQYIEDTGIVVTDMANISYGKKIKLKLGRLHAEINVFYGRRGFSTVVSPRSGTDAELNATCAELIEGYLAQNCDL